MRTPTPLVSPPLMEGAAGHSHPCITHVYALGTLERAEDALGACVPPSGKSAPLPELCCAVSSSAMDEWPLRRAASSWRTLAAATAAAAVTGSGATDVRLQQAPLMRQCCPDGNLHSQVALDISNLYRRLS